MPATASLPPAELARIALRRLAESKLPPTPEHYTRLYYAIEGAPAPPPALPVPDSKVEQRLVESFSASVDKVASATNQVTSSVASHSKEIAESLEHLVDDAPAAEVKELLHQVLAKSTEMQQTMHASQAELLDAQRSLAEIKAELKESNKLIAQDPLTGTSNRRAMTEILEREFSRSRRSDEPLSVAMVDIDHFKKINDSHGHAAGDAALVYIAQAARSILRGNDAFVRYGGEEFLLVLPETATAGAMHVAQRLQQVLVRYPFVYRGQQIGMTFSAGVSMLEDDDDQASLLQRADMAMYRAKAAGRNRVLSGEIEPNDVSTA